MIELKAYAKINLTLDILGRLNDGYHRIESVKQQVDLHDNIKIEPFDGIKVICNNPKIKTRENLVFKTAMLLKNEFNVAEGAKITVEKNIPLAAGLAGGSTNAAAALKGLNELWKLELDEFELRRLANEIGMDVPFSVTGGSCFAEGKGTKLTKIEIPELDVLLVNPGFEISTKVAYNSIDLSNTGKVLATSKLMELKEKDAEKIANLLHNDFEAVVLEEYPDLKEIKKDIVDNGALNSLLSGSGPTVFGIFSEKEKLDTAYEALKDKYKFVHKSKTIR